MVRASAAKLRILIKWRCDEYGVCIYKEVKSLKNVKSINEVFIVVHGEPYGEY